MMKTIQKNVTVNSSIERIFTIIKVLLAVSPFMALGYLTAKGTAGANLQTILSQNPHYTVMFFKVTYKIYVFIIHEYKLSTFFF